MLLPVPEAHAEVMVEDVIASRREFNSASYRDLYYSYSYKTIQFKTSFCLSYTYISSSNGFPIYNTPGPYYPYSQEIGRIDLRVYVYDTW